MEISIRQTASGVVISVSGRMVFGVPARDLHDAVRQLVGQGQRTITVDLDQVSYVDTSGLEALVASYVTCSRSGGRLRLINPNPRTREALRITRLDQLLEGLID